MGDSFKNPNKMGAPRTITSMQQLAQILGTDVNNKSLIEILKSPKFTGKQAYSLAPQLYKQIQDNMLAIERAGGGAMAAQAGAKGILGGPGATPPPPPPPGQDWANSEGAWRAQQAADQAGVRAQREWEAQQAKEGHARQVEIVRMQQEYEKEQRRIEAEATEKARVENLKAERQRIFTDMMGRDPVRAVLFAMGVGGQLVPGGEQFQEFRPMKEAAAKGDTEKALTAMQAKYGASQGTAPVKLSNKGVTGLSQAHQLARLFAQGTTAEKTLALSGLGVGGPGRGGVDKEQALKEAQEVTPTGILNW